MIKPFQMTDLGYFLPNKYSNPDCILDQLTDPTFTVHSMWHEDMVVAIMCCKAYWKNNWACGILISNDFPTVRLREVRSFVDDMMKKHNVFRLQTDSVDDKLLDRFHEFLGFTCEGVRKKLMLGMDYKSWARFGECV